MRPTPIKRTDIMKGRAQNFMMERGNDGGDGNSCVSFFRAPQYIFTRPTVPLAFSRVFRINAMGNWQNFDAESLGLRDRQQQDAPNYIKHQLLKFVHAFVSTLFLAA